MAVGLLISRTQAPAWRAGTSFLLPLVLLSLLVLSARAWASGESAAGAVDEAAAAGDSAAVADSAAISDSATIADSATIGDSGAAADSAAVGDSAAAGDAAAADGAGGATAPRYRPPGATPGVPSAAELESAGAVIGTVLVDNQNIFDLSGSSYSWNSLLNGENADRLKVLGMNFDPHAIPVFFDKQGFHAARGAAKAVNHLYADGHIKNLLTMEGTLPP